MKNILITGGPVHAHIDAVKIVTNTFKGGLMAELATNLSTNFDASVTYLCSKGSKVPAGNPRMKIVFHDGFQDYMEKVKTYSPLMDAVILGAAVANLIPYKPIEGKFPSHNYKPGDLVPLIFQIAPRVIDEVKKVAPTTHLFGFKLLDGVSMDELIGAAYGVLLESHATAIIANDKRNLDQKYVVTKERGVHPVDLDDLAGWLWKMIEDQYYKTNEETPLAEDFNLTKFFEETTLLKSKIEEVEKRGGFYKTPEGFVFGTVAQRCKEGFLTTGRGKKELDSIVRVLRVDHGERKVYTLQGKATLNAPLLDHIFNELPEVQSIVHTHLESKMAFPNLPILDYAPPGTVRDSIRDVNGSFIVKNHGTYLLYDKDNKLIK